MAVEWVSWGWGNSRSREAWYFCVQEFRVDPEDILELLSGLVQGKD